MRSTHEPNRELAIEPTGGLKPLLWHYIYTGMMLDVIE